MILPIRADFPLPGFPVLTVLVCLICFAVFMKQSSDWDDFDHAIQRYCDGNRARIDEIVLKRVDDLKGTPYCGQAMYQIHSSGKADEEIETLVNALKPLTGFNRDDSRDYTRQILHDELRLYRTYVPEDPDYKFAYDTASWNPLHMLSASFAHADWGHIIFNLIFFFAFATTVEAIAGHLNFAIYVLVISLVIGVTDSVASTLADAHHWTLGLSGVVAGMMGMFAYLLPHGKIRVYYFFIVIFGSIAVPGWILALWFVGGDIYQLFTYDEHGGINVLAHVTGGVAGYFYGFFFLRKARQRAAEAQSILDHGKLRPGV
ncbi:MAG: rhomboid family intramembrane serine protease [Woeseiaceae bacterium]